MFIGVAGWEYGDDVAFDVRFIALQAFIPLKLANSLLGKNMPTRHQINTLHIRPQRLRRNGANPPLLLLIHANNMLPLLGVNLKIQLHHIPQSLDAPAQNLLAVCLRADPLRFLAGEQELEDGVFVVQVADAVGDDGADEGFVGEGAGRPEVGLDFTLGFFDLCCAGGFGGLAYEFATGWDAAIFSIWVD